MLRVHFTAEDLMRVAFASEPAPLVELGLAVAMLQRPDTPPVFGRWHHHTQRAFPRDARPLMELVPPSGEGPVFLDTLSHRLDEGIDQVLSSPRALVRSELIRVCAAGRPLTPWIRHLADKDRDAWRVLERAVRSAHTCVLAESWERVRAGFDAEYAWRTRLLARQGIRTTLAGLAPGIRWRGTVLEIDSPGESTDLHLDGLGLVLLPSTLWSGRPVLVPRPNAATVMCYAAVTPFPLLEEPSSPDPVAALLGRTRAAILTQLTRQSTTTDLARELGISKSSASEHAKALREAHLIVTQREGQSVWHSCTPLGLDLLAANNRLTGPTH